MSHALAPRPARPKVSPQSDPRFRRVMETLQQGAAKSKKHAPASKKAGEASAAARGPANEKAAGAKSNQVDKLKEAPAEKPKNDSFLELLRSEIQAAMPKTLGDTDDFMKGDKPGAMKSSLKGSVGEEKNKAAGAIQGASNAKPSESGVAAKEVTPIPAEPAPAAPAVDAAQGMPLPKSNEDVSLQYSKQDTGDEMKEAHVTPLQLKKANDPRFSAVLTAKDAVAKQADAGPAQYRAGEKGVLASAASQAQAQGKAGAVAMAGVRGKSNSAVLTKQSAAKAKEELERKQVTDHIEEIFTRTKASVDAKLAALETEVNAVFDAGIDAALNTMTSFVEARLEEYKDERYSGVIGKGRWLKDKLLGLPHDADVFYTQGRVVFTQTMDNLVVRVAALVELRLKEAKDEVAKGKAEIATYVQGLKPSLQSVGKDAQKEMEGRFKELEQGIDDKKNQLAQSLAQKYKEASDKADDALKEIQDANKGLVTAFVEKLGEIVKILLEFKDKLMALLKKAADVIGQIVDDPIGFLGNLIGAIKQGIQQFVKNIWTHLKKGFMKWLFGSLAEAGIEIPSDLTLPSILKLVLGVLGITYERMRAKAVKLIGERAVKFLEKVFEYVKALITGGPAALWEKVKEDLGNLKEMVIDAIQNWLIETVVKQAAIKLVSLFNPAGAIIQAILAIYNVITFLIDKASQIMALVEAVINSVAMIVAGNIGAAATWIENALGDTIPLVIGFLAQFIGLGGISKKIKETITKVQNVVDKAIDKAIAKVVGFVKKLFGGGKDTADGGKPGAEDHLQDATYKLPFAMGSHGHTVTASLKGGSLQLTMASGKDEVLSMALGSAISKTETDQPKRDPSQKKAILGYLIGAKSQVDSIAQDWAAAEARDPRGGNKKLTYEQFMQVRIGQIINQLKPLAKYKIEDLHDLLKVLDKRRIPSGYDIRKKLYDRTTGGGWTSLSESWKLPRIAAVSKQVFAIWRLREDKSKADNYKNAEKQWNALIDIEPGGLDPEQIPTFASYDHARDFPKFKYQTDHKIPLGNSWASGEKNQDDASRSKTTLDQGNFQLLTRKKNREKSGEKFEREVGPDFTSNVANAPKDSQTLDGVPFE